MVHSIHLLEGLLYMYNEMLHDKKIFHKHILCYIYLIYLQQHKLRCVQVFMLQCFTITMFLKINKMHFSVCVFDEFKHLKFTHYKI